MPACPQVANVRFAQNMATICGDETGGPHAPKDEPLTKYGVNQADGNRENSRGDEVPLDSFNPAIPLWQSWEKSGRALVQDPLRNLHLCKNRQLALGLERRTTCLPIRSITSLIHPSVR